MNPKTLVQKYLQFFQEKEHAIIESASLIPVNDASVLFNTAGMQPLVPYLLGQTHPNGTRLADLQKCLRTVDFENIGDNTHHTFFLMLGNWSLGDYFKKEMISWSFEFLTSDNWLGIPLTMLAFTVYEGDETVPRDDESAKLWQDLGVPQERIAYLGKDNFWSAGETGPCGPSTEMFYWTGDEQAPEKYDPQDERWVEIWNDVFMAYNKHEGGAFEELEKKNVDTGMGFERTLAVLCNEKSAYETGLFRPIIEKIETLSNKVYNNHKREMRIIADHIRAAVFILGDENYVVPSNVDRGYILRRLIRRAIKYGKGLGIQDAFTTLLAHEVIEIYTAFFAELEQHKQRIVEELQKEEAKFAKTLEKGLREFEKMSATEDVISGSDAFLLFQSYGFPIEMTQELAKEQNMSVDLAVFDEEFRKHQELSRSAAAGKFKGGLADHSQETVRLHTATHLLNEALRKVISPDIIQRGSNITPERLRFDFNFDRKLTSEELKAVEDEVNRVIKAQLEVRREEMSLDEAKQIGAQMEFGVKYSERVSVYFVGDYSKEFCGGPHVTNTSEIGRFKIVKEKSSAAGIRRIKAVVE